LRDPRPRLRFCQIDSVVHRVSQFLLAAEIALGRLDRNMPEQKLNLLQFSAGEMAQARATPAKIVGSKIRDSSPQCRSLHHMPNGFGRDVVAPELRRSC
jgi:hypothetical protein